VLKGRARSRHGATLLELLVVMIVGGIALGLLAAISTRQQRTLADVADATALSSQLREAASILPIDLRGLSVSAGDLREARDTAIEFRGTIASAVICDTTPHGVVLAPATPGGGPFSGFLASPDVGDTAWILRPNDSLDVWWPYRISTAASATPGACLPLGPSLSTTARTLSRSSITFDASPPLADLIGAPLRITRPFRYSLYRASDNLWYLGARDWNSTALRLNTIQPVSGPYLSAAQGGLRFQYLDTSGVTLPTPIADAGAISLIRIDIRGQTRSLARVLGSGQAPIKRTDSATSLILMHNRR
jgi:prepilin-type N-terminal cleavage/methylation domain-containing protein